MTNAQTAKDRPQRLYVIDALRGIAALYVIVFHVVKVPEPDLAVPRLLSAVLENGGSGVTLFFVLSAFTLCYTLDQRAGERLRVTKFYIRRVLRIAPLYFVWLAVMTRNFSPADWAAQRGLVLACVSFTYNLKPEWREGIVWASWTLGVEMLFYLLFPLIFRFVRSVRSSLAFLAITGALAAAHQAIATRSSDPVARDAHFIRMSLAHQMPIFAVGICVYFCFRAIRERPNVPARLGVGLIAAGLGSFFAFCLIGSTTLPIPIFYLISLSYAALTLGLLLTPVHALANRGAVFFGVISYSMYLNHPRVVGKLEPAFHALEAKGWPSAVSFALCALAALVPITLISCVTYVTIEQPFIRLGSRLIRWIDPRASKRHSANETPADALLQPKDSP